MEKNLLTLVTGGARSGKSSFGESILKDIDGQVLYIATAQAFDDEMKDRIKKHREGRPENWVTLEGYKNLAEEVQRYKGKVDGIFLDCITIMTTNLMFEEPIDWDVVSMDEVNKIEKNILKEIQDLIKVLKDFHVPVVFITNELGLGIVPENKIARIFRDIAGRVNQYIGREVSNVYFVTCGIANKIK
ncbi:bifunctional adenosylcobalamin biosynthesis protein CobU [Clostridium aceticum]|uniref:Adenosylcobinamide kinase n=1 Tax=Clostridium aceticum TaxID=84022 RepID=A0A0D8IDD0_9CLOT|nr:bifunctional adenosylcobinamide kinase/adenosylcobinamide-phosphate guanylyltransferase [Clostridium aceticum]AKL94462.1 bifunctional adenosylcobalamin biosynthesis protein CobU [Clostridium aceticum]KJF28320.1 cobinamide kinase [Clostridium aceticum]